MSKRDPVFGLRKVDTTLWACYNKGGKIINTPTEQTAYSIFDINRAHTECSELNKKLEAPYEVAEKGRASEIGSRQDVYSLTDVFLAVEGNAIKSKTEEIVEEVKKEIKTAAKNAIGQIDKAKKIKKNPIKKSKKILKD